MYLNNENSNGMMPVKSGRAWTALIMILALACAPLVAANAAVDTAVPGSGGELIYMVNGDPVAGDAPVVLNDRLLVPLDVLAGELLIEYSQNAAADSMDLVRGDETTVLPMEQKLAIIDGNRVPIDVGATSFGSQVYVPLRVVVESFGGNVQWDNAHGYALVIDQPSLYLEGIDARIIKVYDAAQVNQWWLQKGYTEEPYRDDAPVVEAELEADYIFGRVYDGDVSGKYGGWLLQNSALDALQPEEIRDTWALPALPLYRVDVLLVDGIHFRAGLAAPVAEWGDGGGIQYDLMGEKVGDFVNERSLLN